MILQKHQQLIEDLKLLNEQMKNMRTEQEAEIKKATELIKEKYSEKWNLKQLQRIETEDRIKDYEREYEKKSTFAVEQIGHIITQLLNRCTGRSYSLRTVQYDERDRDAYGWGMKKQFYLTAIIQDEAYKQKYSDFDNGPYQAGEMFYMKHDGKILVLNSQAYQPVSEDNKNIPQIKFYHFLSNTQGRRLNDNMRDSLYNERFGFVHEFLDLVIAYRLENDVENITYEELSKLLTQFLNQNEEQIKASFTEFDNKRPERVLQKNKTS